MLRLKHVCPETCFRINKPTLSKPNKLMSNSATPPPAARASNTPTAAELTPDSLCEQAFEKDMERILHYQEKFPKLDTAGMITKAMAEREARKQVAFDEKLKWAVQVHAPRTDQAHSDDGDGECTETPRYKKRKRASPGSRAKSAAKGSAPLVLTEKFLSRIERSVNNSTTRCASCLSLIHHPAQTYSFCCRRIEMKEEGGAPQNHYVPNKIGKGTAWRLHDEDSTVRLWGRPDTLPTKCPLQEVAFTCLLCGGTPHYSLQVDICRSLSLSSLLLFIVGDAP